MLVKLNAYGVNNRAYSLLLSYFESRQKRVKHVDVRNEWLKLEQGAPQGSIMGYYYLYIIYVTYIFYKRFAVPVR